MYKSKRCILQTLHCEYPKCISNPKQQGTTLVPNLKQATLLKAIGLTSRLNFKIFCAVSLLLSLYVVNINNVWVCIQLPMQSLNPVFNSQFSQVFLPKTPRANFQPGNWSRDGLFWGRTSGDSQVSCRVCPKPSHTILYKACSRFLWQCASYMCCPCPGESISSYLWGFPHGHALRWTARGLMAGEDLTFQASQEQLTRKLVSWNRKQAEKLPRQKAMQQLDE